MRKAEVDGQVGYYDEETEDFYPEGALKKAEVDGKMGMYNPETEDFYPMELDVAAQPEPKPSRWQDAFTSAMSQPPGTFAPTTEEINEDAAGAFETPGGRAITGGVAETGKSLGTLAKIAGRELQDPQGAAKSIMQGPAGQKLADTAGAGLEAAGSWVEDTLRPTAEKYAQPEKYRGKNPVDNPEILGEPEWWIDTVGRGAPSMAASLVPAFAAGKVIQYGGKALSWTPAVVDKLVRLGAAVSGGAVGGGLEGAGTYEQALQQGMSEPEARSAAEKMTLISAGLNAISLDKALGSKGTSFVGKLWNQISKGITEGITEGAEEPAQALLLGTDLKQSLKDATTTGLAGFALGALVPGSSARQPAPRNLDEYIEQNSQRKPVAPAPVAAPAPGQPNAQPVAGEPLKTAPADQAQNEPAAPLRRGTDIDLDQFKESLRASGVDPDAPQFKPVIDQYLAKRKQKEPAQADRRLSENAGWREHAEAAKKLAIAGDEGSRKELIDSGIWGNPEVGIMNKSGWDALPRKKHQAYLDMDDLTMINGIMGHPAGDTALKEFRDGLAELEQFGIRVAHKSGDEHLAESDDYDILQEKMEALRQKLSAREFSADKNAGDVLELAKNGPRIKLDKDTTIIKKGIGIAYGIGQDEQTADSALFADKSDRTSKGIRGAGGFGRNFGAVPRGERAGALRGQPSEVTPSSDAELIGQAASFMGGKTRLDTSFPFMSWRPSVKKSDGKWQQMTHDQASEWLDKVARGEVVPRTAGQKNFVKRAIAAMQQYNEQEAAYEALPPVQEVSPTTEEIQLDKGSIEKAQPKREAWEVPFEEAFSLTPEQPKSATPKPVQSGIDLGLKGDALRAPERGQGSSELTELERAANEAADRKKQGGFFDSLKNERGAAGNLDNVKETKEPAESKNLATVHNISIANVRHALKMGGIPVPSLAAIDVNKSDFHGFGDITLIAKKGTFAPERSRENKWHGADAYSPRYPSVTHFITKNTADTIKGWLADAHNAIQKKPTGDKDYQRYFGEYSWENDIEREGIAGALKRNELAQAAFLQESGSLPKGLNNTYEGKEKVRKAVEKAGQDKFESWVDEKVSTMGLRSDEKIFNGFTNAGKRRYLPHDLDTVVKLLKIQMKEGEGFNYGAGSVRSKVTPQFKTLKQIQESRDKIVSSEAFDKIKDEANDELIALSDHYKSYLQHPPSNSFGFADTFSEHIKEAVDTRNFKKTFDQYYDAGVDLQPVLDFVEKLRNMPTEYFEGKIQRSVQLNEFDTAIVPNDTPSDVKDALGKQGVKIVEYKKGDNADRKQKIKDVTTENRADYLYSFPAGPILQAIKAAKDAKAAYPHLVELGQKVMLDGKTKFSAFQSGMKSYLGDMWQKFKGMMERLFFAAKAANKKLGSTGLFIGPKGSKAFAEQRWGKFSDIADKKERVEISDEGAKIINKMESAWEAMMTEGTRLRHENPGKSIDNLVKAKSPKVAEYQRLSKIHDQKMHGSTLSDYLEHAAIYEQYPWLADVKIKMLSHAMDGASGGYNSLDNTIYLDAEKYYKTPAAKDFKSTLLHEVQHAIQEHEGFARGSSPELMEQAIKEAERINDSPLARKVFGNDRVDAANALKKAVSPYDKQRAFKLYRRVAGEEESRRVSARANMTAAERMGTPYEKSDLAPGEDRIVRAGSGISQSTGKPTLAEWMKAVEGAIAAGKNVPQNVIDDYVKRGGKLKDVLRGTNVENAGEVPPPTKYIPVTTEKSPDSDTKESKLAKRAESDAIKEKLTEDFGDLAEYRTMNMQEQADKAAAIMAADYESAKRMAMGEELPPQGVREATMYEAVKIRALKEGDTATLYNLAVNSTVPTRLSEYGQAIKAADSRLMDDPVKVMQEVIRGREERAKRTGKDPVSIAKIEALTKELNEVTERLRAHEEAASKKQAKSVEQEIKKQVFREAKRASRSASKTVLDEEFSGLAKQLRGILRPGSLNMSIGAIDPSAIPVLVAMAKNRIKSGMLHIEGVVDSIYAEVKNILPDITKRNVRDAISGYGKQAQMSKEEIDVRLRELKRQARLISALEDAKSGQAPLKSGLTRDEVTDEVRALTKEVKQAMRDSGIDSETTRSPEQQYKSALDAVKTRLRNQIHDINKQLETGQKTPKNKGIEYDAEANALKAERDKVRAMLRDIEGKPEMSPEQRVRVATAAVERSIAELERRIAEHDLVRAKKESKTPVTPELSRLRSLRDGLKVQFKEMQDAAKAPKDPAAIRLKTFKTRTANEIARLEKKLADGDFVKAEKAPPAELDEEGKKLKAAREIAKENYHAAMDASRTVTKEEAAEIVRLSKVTETARKAMEQGGDRLEYGSARVAYENYVNDLKRANAPIKELLKDRIGEFKTAWKENKARAAWELQKDTIKTTTDNSIAMVASLDNSFLGRQGLKTLMTHPTAWWPGAKNSFLDFAKTLGGKETMDALNADIYSRPNYVNGEYLKAKIITKTEEQYPDTLPERIPGVGRLFKASEVAFTGSALRMRTDLYDMLSAKAKENGAEMDKAQIESIGKLINSLTARGQWGERGESTIVRLILWAPKMLKGNIDVLTAHNFGAGLETGFARKEAALNLLKIVSITAVLMAIANALKPDSTELDPRSSDFGKIKVGTTRFDITGGAASIVTLAARIIPGLWGDAASKSTTTGLVTPYGIGYGKRSPFDALIDFVNNKTTPAAGVVSSWLKGKNRDNEAWTVGDAAYRAFTPISMQNMIKLKDDVSADKIAGALVDFIGINSNSYGDSSAQRGDIVDKMRAGKPLNKKQQEAFDAMSKTQQRNIEKESELTAIQAGIKKLPIEDALYAWAEASEKDKDKIRATLIKKIKNSKKSSEEKDAYFAKMGIKNIDEYDEMDEYDEEEEE